MVLRRILKIVLLMFVFMAVTGISTYLTIHLLIRGEDTVVVPQLTGKEVIYALQLLSDLGLNTKVKGSEFSAEVPKNQVISQDPEPGSEIKKGRDVRIVISKGARAVIIPNVTGLGVPQARILLEQNDLGQGELSYVYSEKRPEEEIVSQYPAAGVHGWRGDRIDLLISAGHPPALMAMTDLKGMNIAQAVQTIERYQLLTGTIQTVQDLSVANDLVVSHAPQSGYPLPKGSVVDLVVNRHGRAETPGRQEEARLFRHRTAQGFLKQHVRVRLTRRDTARDIYDEFVRPGREIWLLITRDGPATLLLYVDEELIKTVHYD